MTTLNEAILAQQTENAMREAKSSQGIFDLPCGYLTPEGELFTEVQVREITGAEEDMLGAKNISGGKKITQLLANCVQRIGSITDKDQLLQVVRSLPLGDRVFLMLAIRRVTLGDMFPFEEKCPSCGKSEIYNEDLSELAAKAMPEPKKRVYDTVLPSGITARFHVMTGKDEEVLVRADMKDQASAAVMARLDLLNDKHPTIEDVKALGLRDRNALRDAYEEVEGGVETTLNMGCPFCGQEFQADLNPGSTGFFFPSRLQKNSKISTSSS